jgi:superfamily II DNA or RNA helicase
VLLMPELGSGDRVRLVSDPAREGILTGARKDAASVPLLQVAFFQGNKQWVPVDQLEVVPEQGEAPRDLLRRGRLAHPADLYRVLSSIRLSGRLADFVYSLEMTETDFYAYQFKPVLKLLQSVSTGILIADEVGLGKTIEAGLIWTELRARFDLRRLLVLCPAMLREKWQRELRRRFGVKADILDAAGLLRLLQQVADGEEPEFTAIASIQGLRPPSGWDESEEMERATAKLAQLLSRRAQEEPIVDLLVVDEAHYLRNPETQTAELGRLVRAVSQYAVFLSATPVHLKSEDLFHLLRLVDEDLFSRQDVFEFITQANEHLVTARDAVLGGTVSAPDLRNRLVLAQRHPLLEGNRQIQALVDDLASIQNLSPHGLRAEIASRLETANLLGFAVTRTRKREVTEWRVIRDPCTHKVTMAPLEAEFYSTVTAVVRDYCARGGQAEGFLLVMPQRQMASCMAAAYWHWSQDDTGALEELWEELGIELPEAEPASLGPLVQELRARVGGLASLRALTDVDTKYGHLRQELRHLLAADSHEKVVLFSSFRHTLRYLEERLRKDGISCIVLVGGQTDKDEIVEQFGRPDGPSVLLSSEVGSEGIDLQFARILVNYDLPWNPMRVEQRIGRLDRIGQKAERIAIWNLLHADTIDERIYDRLYMRLGIFERALGGLEAILGAKINAMTRDLFQRGLTPQQEGARIDQTRLAVEHIRQEEERLESEAGSLVAYGDYILNQVRAARELSRRVTGGDIRRFVIDYMEKEYPGSRFLQIEDSLFDVDLSAQGRSELAAFLKERRLGTATALARNLPGPLRCRFENRLQAGRGDDEVISQLHPLVRFVAHRSGASITRSLPAVAARIACECLPGVPPGRYRFAVARWTVDALRTTEQLWYGVEPLEGGEPLNAELAERFVTTLAAEGAPWPLAQEECDLGAAAEGVEQMLLVRADADYRADVTRVSAQNEDRADAARRSLETHRETQRGKFARRYSSYVEKGLTGFARVEQRNRQKLEARVEREILKIEEKRTVRHSFDEISVGVALVE